MHNLLVYHYTTVYFSIFCYNILKKSAGHISYDILTMNFCNLNENIIIDVKRKRTKETGN